MYLLTFLGTADLKVTTYVMGMQRHETRYFAAALVRFLEPTPEYTLIVVTEAARQKHFETLADEIHTVTQPIEVLIPDGCREEELWDIFDTLTQRVPDGSELVVDITNGFRSLPFLSFLAVAYLRKAKGVDVQRVYYGAYEARNERNESPVFDLTPFVTLLDWIVATDRFTRFGDARDLAELLRAGMPTGVQMGQNEKARRLGKSLKWTAEAMEAVSLALRLSRPLESMEQAQRLVQRLQRQCDIVRTHARPFSLLTDRIIQAYRSLALASPQDLDRRLDNLRVQWEIVRWYMEKEQVVQAITLAREWFISLLLYHLTDKALTDRDAREQVEAAITNVAEWQRSQSKQRPPQDTPFTDEVADLASRYSLVDVWNKLSRLRNDLAHAGMRPDASRSSSLLRRARQVVCDLHDLAEELVEGSNLVLEERERSVDTMEKEMILLNFGHPLTQEQRTQIEQLIGGPIDRLIEVATHFDHTRPFAEQVRELVDSLGLTSEEWQHAAIFVNPSTLSAIAMTLLAELHGRMGYFAPVVRMRPVEDVLPPRFEAAEIINLQQVREEARGRRIA